MSSRNDFPLTRRNFLMQIARAGGAGAALHTLDTLGASSLAVGPAHRYAGPPPLPRGSGKGKRVTIIGAGMAGLVSAHELSKAGFTCTVLEARTRPGGRNWTVRGGDRIAQTDSQQYVHWPNAPHLYMNVGPARIPNHHHAVLAYCKEFDVPVEIMMNDNRAALLHDESVFSGKPVEARQVINDTRGYMSELLAKALGSGTLDTEVSKEDRERLVAMIRSFGDLKEKDRYSGSERAGFAEHPGAGLNTGKLRTPLSLSDLVKADFWEFKMHFGEFFDQASTMLQPIGGMDRIPYAFAKKLGNMIRYDMTVAEIRKTATGARVMFHNASKKSPMFVIDSDFVICTMPLPVLKTIPNDLTLAMQTAIASARYATPGKIGFYAPRRFWEEDYGIYGGMSWTTREITNMLYPSHGLRQKDGVLVGSYTFGMFPGDDVSKTSVPGRIANAITSGERLHPGYGKLVQNGISVAWPNVPHSLGGWAMWEPEQRATSYAQLLEPDGPIYLAGEHLSYLPGWQEGAILSAHRAIEQIARKVAA